MKRIDFLADVITIRPEKQMHDGRWFHSYARFMSVANVVCMRVTGGVGLEDFADTVFTHDAWEDGMSPVDLVEEILGNDSIGSCILSHFITSARKAVTS